MTLLRGWSGIAQAFGVTSKLARQWYDRGAPIFIIGKVPVAELAELWEWLKSEYG